METNLQSNEVRIPKSPQLTPNGCSTFKSAFARSLSFSSNQQNKPLDFEINLRISQSSLNDEQNIPMHHPSSPSRKLSVDDRFSEFIKNKSLKNLERNTLCSTRKHLQVKFSLLFVMVFIIELGIFLLEFINVQYSFFFFDEFEVLHRL